MVIKALAIDAMSGDFGPRITIPATVAFAMQHPDIQCLLVGDSAKLAEYSELASVNNIQVIHADSVIAMDAKPAQVLRESKASSIAKCLQLLSDNDASAMVSAGNTGALMALSKHQLTMLSDVSRPAICGALPALDGQSYLLDMGANIDCSAEELHAFAKMGSLLVQTIDKKQNPTVALLNIGEENSKGNKLVQQTKLLLEQDASLNYVGFVEANKLYSAEADVIVCDGFAGNIALKASEGVAAFIIEKVKAELSKDSDKYSQVLAMPELLDIKAQIDPRRHNGAIFLGLDAAVIKSHGNADKRAFLSALQLAGEVVESDTMARIGQHFLSLKEA